MQKSLNKFKIGEKGKVIKIEGEGKLRRRMLDMGITPGVEILLHNVAPLGDPIEIKLRGYDLSIRKDEAAKIIMEVD